MVYQIRTHKMQKNLMTSEYQLSILSQ